MFITTAVIKDNNNKLKYKVSFNTINSINRSIITSNSISNKLKLFNPPVNAVPIIKYNTNVVNTMLIIKVLMSTLLFIIS